MRIDATSRGKVAKTKDAGSERLSGHRLLAILKCINSSVQTGEPKFTTIKHGM